MKILVLVRTEGVKSYYRAFIPEDVEMKSVTPKGSEIPIATSARDQLYFIEAMKAAEKEGFDALIPSCHLGPAVEEGRTLVKIPVLSVACVGMHLSAMLGDKFSIIAITQGMRRAWLHKAVEYSCEKKLASVRCFDVGPDYVDKLQRYGELGPTKEVTPELQKTLEEAIKAIEEDDATVIMLGCGGLTWMGDRLADLLENKGYNITVVNPLPLTIEMAKILVKSKISHSPLAYYPVL